VFFLFFSFQIDPGDLFGALLPGGVLARGEFSIVIASLGAGLADGDDLGAVAAAFVLVTAIAGPLATRALDPPGPPR
jgi:CPA2 family monovalent cation:H+ antiporter-2